MLRRLFSCLRSVCVLAMLAQVGCPASHRSGLPEGSPFPPADAGVGIGLSKGIASGDVTHESALIWSRTDGAALVQVEWWPEQARDSAETTTVPSATSRVRSEIKSTTPAEDFTLKVLLTDLRPDTVYRYRVWAAPPSGRERFGAMALPSGTGRFRTAPGPEDRQEVTFVWSGDLGGQGRCRQGEAGYPIFDRILTVQPRFFLFLGDLIYGDERCPSPPNAAGSEFAATTLDDYRGKHRYQYGASALRRLLAEVPVWAIWDDHEVRNNFSGPYEPQMPAARQALLEYWPIRTPPEDPTRLYRKVRYGADLELFILDTRQYRSRNQEPDGPNKTMLGPAQLAWLIEAVTRSTATWKLIATSVPLSHPDKASPTIPGNDGWARGKDGSGFESELSTIVQSFLARGVRNVVWLGGDVHYVQGVAYDPTGDGMPDFHEFIAGPLSAYSGRPAPPPPTFRPTLLFAETGFYNFGVVTADHRSLRVEILDAEGRVRHRHRLEAREPGEQ